MTEKGEQTTCCRMLTFYTCVLTLTLVLEELTSVFTLMLIVTQLTCILSLTLVFAQLTYVHTFLSQQKLPSIQTVPSGRRAAPNQTFQTPKHFAGT